MGRADFGTAKYASKQMKLSGLQKTSFYCQICTKQCRDLNGFKNHQMSPSHLRKVEEMTTTKDSKTIVGEFLGQFERDFLSLLKRSHGTKWINANKFYQEYIQDRHHVHLNSTKWMTLTLFIRSIGKRGVIQVDEDDEFLIIRMAGQEVLDKAVEERDGIAELISKQIELGKQQPQKQDQPQKQSQPQTQKQKELKPFSIKLNQKSKSKSINSVFESDSD